MNALILLTISLLGANGTAEYARAFNAKRLDAASLSAEGFGETKALIREDDGLRITLAPGDQETGWKTPQTVRIGGDFTIAANLVVKTLPKPAQEDGVAVGVAIAFQDINQPDLAFVRLREPNGSEVYRSIEKAGGPQSMPMQGPMMMNMGMVWMGQPGAAKPPKPPRHTFPAAGEVVRMELQREGNVIRLQVHDAKTNRPRYLGQAQLGNGNMDVAAVKLFVSNRNGAEPINVLWRDVSIRADRIMGLGTVVRTVFDMVVYGDPTGIEKGRLIIGGPPKNPAGGPPNPGGGAQPPGPGVVQVAAAPVAPPGAPAAPPGPAALGAGGAGSPATPPGAPAAPIPAPPPVAPPSAAPQVAPSPAPGPKPASGPPAVATAPNAFPNGTNAFQAQPPTPPKPPEPKARIPIGELESIRFERTPSFSGRFLGQVNADFTGPGLGAKKEEKPPKDGKDKPKKPDTAEDVLAPPPGTASVTKVPKVEPKKNGIRDLDIVLAGLRNVAIKQVTVNTQTDKGQAAWRLDTTDSQDSPLVLRRSGTEEWADLFLEPPEGDCHQKNFTVAVTYADGQMANTQVQAGDHHTDPKLALDPKTAPSALLDAWVFLAGEEKLYGRLGTIGESTLTLTTPWQDKLEIPLAHVVGIHVGLLDRKESPEAFAKRLKSRGSEDLLLAQTKDGEVLAVPGILEGTQSDRLRFQFQGRTRTLPLTQVEGLVLANRLQPKRPAGPRPTFSLPGGLVISGRWTDLDTATWKVETAWGQSLNLPANEVQGVRFHGGDVAFLSDLDPSRVEETPFFGRRLPWRRDVNLQGEPLRMDGRTFERGVAVHSRCDLTYDLEGRYTTFEALVGFDDAAKRKGRVELKVLADGKEIYANPDVRADRPPLRLVLPVTGAQQLRLLTDFGADQDTGDRVIWANARLLRRAPAQETTADSRAPSRSKE